MSTAPKDGTQFVQTTLGVLGGKWKILILWNIRDQPKRLSELKRLIPEISEKVLIQQLRDLEKDGIVNRRDYAEVPPRVDYSFTAHGETLKPIFCELCNWGELHLKQLEMEDREIE
ncbi:helix-turn-helix transcriptional regulator [filamentous cyanobacterium LEGE 11480]|uniref:Helix-turn-helix transcriptional regulator n=1 Tax=Romeriopsis navalis LEGE 11480 TaxID=2777977 RepID=A0A928VT91_9CYAN|nr:helix-turn-helix domain-containing protein [Romeriopsis navalis]MBE9033293.1 helix-turn-helix transcriptional regulator [Romeriopsis navalis LEGE 11480]